MEASFTTARIVYFSGTGGARRVAGALRQELAGRRLDAGLLALEGPAIASGWGDEAKPDLLVLVFAVHAFDAPAPVYAWVRGADLNGVHAAVLSVSGGGEAWPNTGCRAHIISDMERRGCAVVYDRMLVMPCNWVFATDPHLSMHLLQAMPTKARAIADDLLAGRARRSAGKLDFIRAWITDREKTGGRRFGKLYRVSNRCNGCGWCERNCPTSNIELSDGRPVFKDECLICFRCIYGCPRRAITSKNFMVLQGGFDLNKLEKEMQGVELKPVAQCCKGWMWKGVRSYLLDADK